jgi:hypothetical protein
MRERPGRAQDALEHSTDPQFPVTTTFVPHRAKLAELAMTARFPIITFLREFTEAGCLLSYGVNMSDFVPRHRQTALLSKQPLGSAQVVHPFHPLRGQRFIV